MTSEQSKYIEAAAELAAANVETRLTKTIGEMIGGMAKEFRDEHAKQGKSFSEKLKDCQDRQEKRRRWSVGTWLHSATLAIAFGMALLALYKG